MKEGGRRGKTMGRMLEGGKERKKSKGKGTGEGLKENRVKGEQEGVDRKGR